MISPYIDSSELSDDVLALAKQRDVEIENDEVETLSRTQLMSRLRDAL
ncbi:MAG: hypothetical protein ACXV8Q_16950 [Methylobacter sp.]